MTFLNVFQYYLNIILTSNLLTVKLLRILRFPLISMKSIRFYDSYITLLKNAAFYHVWSLLDGHVKIVNESL
jgi:hypothetical protein